LLIPFLNIISLFDWENVPTEKNKIIRII
jgi:hypothetical protein